MTWKAIAAITVLAGLDLVGALLAKEFSQRPRWFIMAGGVVAFGLLFLVYVRTLSLAQMWTVTIGWVTVLEIGMMVLDRLRFGTQISLQKAGIGALIVLLQIALLLPDRTAA